MLTLKHLKPLWHVSIFTQIIFRELVGSLLKSLNSKFLNFKNAKDHVVMQQHNVWWVCARACVCMCVCMYIRTYVRMYVCNMYVYMYVCVCVYMYVCMYVRTMYVCNMNVCMYVCRNFFLFSMFHYIVILHAMVLL